MTVAIRLFFVLLLFSGSVFAEEASDATNQQIEALNERVEQLEKQLQAQKSWLAPTKSFWQERFRFNGFASFGFSKVDGSIGDEKYYQGQNGDLSVLPNTWLGLRIDTRLYESAELVAQFVVKADREDNLEIKTEWLFLKQELGHGFSAHLGRIRFPVHIDSEVIYVGNVYPTVMPSAEIYSVLSMNHLDGASLNHTFQLGQSNWVMDSKLILWGQGQDSRSDLSFRLKSVQGGALSFYNDVLTTRIGYFTAKKHLDVDSAPNVYTPKGIKLRISDRLDYLTAAVRFDNQRLYGLLEGIAINSHNHRVDEIRNWNALAGVYIGPSMIYLGYAHQNTINAKQLERGINKAGANIEVANPYCPPATPTGQTCVIAAGGEFAHRYTRHQKKIQLGVKYDVTPRVVLKAQTQMLRSFKGTRGVFEHYDDTYNAQRNHIYIYDVAVQAFF